MAQPRYASAYLEAMLEARVRFRGPNGIPAQALERLYREYAVMLVRVTEDLAAGRVTAERAVGISRSIQAEMRSLVVRMNAAFERFRGDSMAAAVDAHEIAIDVAQSAAGFSAPKVAFDVVPAQVPELMVARRGVGYSNAFRTLMTRRVQSLAPEIDAWLTSVVTRGVDSDDASKELATILSRGEPRVLSALKSLGARGGRTRQAILESVTVDPALLKQAKSVLFDSRRIVVTEINTSFYEADRLASAADPIVDLLRWTLSGRHGGLESSPDVCDYYAQANMHGYGEGLYHPETLPPLPHPHCLCYNEKVLRPPSDWGKPKRKIPPAQLPDRQSLEAYLRSVPDPDGNGPKITDRYVAAQHAMLVGSRRAAETMGARVTVSRYRPSAPASTAPVPTAALPGGPRTPALAELPPATQYAAASLEEARSWAERFIVPPAFPAAYDRDFRWRHRAAGLNDGAPLTPERLNNLTSRLSKAQADQVNQALADTVGRFGLDLHWLGTRATGRGALGAYTRNRSGPELKELDVRASFARDFERQAREFRQVYTDTRTVGISRIEAALSDPAVSAPRRQQLETALRLVRAATRYSTAEVDPSRALYLVTVHEAGHALYYQRGLARAFRSALQSRGVLYDQETWRRVSEYGATEIDELWAEAFALLIAGLESELPRSIVEAMQEVLAGVSIPVQ